MIGVVDGVSKRIGVPFVLNLLCACVAVRLLAASLVHGEVAKAAATGWWRGEGHFVPLSYEPVRS